MSESKEGTVTDEGITVSDEVDGRTKYTEFIRTRMPKVHVDRKRQGQREVKIGG